MKAVIFFAHGSGRQETNRTFFELAEKVAAELNLWAFEVAFVEPYLPSFQQAFDSCIEKGADAILVYPHFLSSGVHLTRDLAAEIAKARSVHPKIEINTALPLGEHPGLPELIARIVKEGLLR